MASANVPPAGGAGNPPPIITDVAPDVITIGPDYMTGGVAFELYDATANVGFRTTFDVGDALDVALRLGGACIRLRRLLTP
jgi:hypothetical protein